MNNFSSVFSLEMQNYIKLLSEEGRNISKIQGLLRRLDKHLFDNDLNEKILTAQIISDWLNDQDIRTNTKSLYISRINGFVKYLTSLGISATCPEQPKDISSYVPYIFSDDELNRIFSVADDFYGTVRFIRTRFTRSSILFPILLRIFYGCELRLGEGLSLRWKDVDLEQGIITVRVAKDLKQRFVPMSTSLTEILKDYLNMVQREKICADYLFESENNHGQPYSGSWFRSWFGVILKKADIEYTRADKNERGSCPHCMRHTFTMKSFLKSDSEGRRFEDTAPFLAAYLGHDSSVGTETYLSTNHTLYTRSHKRVNAAIGNLFPEVCFDEE